MLKIKVSCKVSVLGLNTLSCCVRFKVRVRSRGMGRVKLRIMELVLAFEVR